jgi:molecular chaperone GrpE (heat shock protein)
MKIKTKPKELKENETDKWKSLYARALADISNLEKQHQTDFSHFLIAEKRRIFMGLFEIIDDLTQIHKELGNDTLKLITRKFTDYLAAQGVKTIEAKVGDAFNTVTMEVVGIGDGPIAGQVLEMVRPGYQFADSILRPIRVIVSKKQNAPNQPT